MADFFTSDLHMGHRLMVNKERYVSKYRNYQDTDEMDNDMIVRINKQATHEDTIYVIGDFSFHKTEQTRKILQRINADVVLIKGNHDHRKKNSFQSMVEYSDELAEFHMYLERKFTVCPQGDPQLIVMFHFPLMHWHKQHYGSWHLHGHLHGNPSGVPGKCLDVGWDVHGKLLSLKDVAKIMNTKPERGNHHEERN